MGAIQFVYDLNELITICYLFILAYIWFNVQFYYCKLSLNVTQMHLNRKKCVCAFASGNILGINKD